MASFLERVSESFSRFFPSGRGSESSRILVRTHFDPPQLFSFVFFQA